MIVAPILFNKNAFTALGESTFSFNWSGSQAIKNRLRIFDNVTNQEVYTSVLETFQLKHTIPSNVLQNGKTYWAEVYVIDANSVESPPSNKIIFKCYSTPTWKFVNLVPNQIIQNSFYEVELSYLQPDGELLNSYQVSLYSSGQSLLHQSGVLYSTESLSYRVSNLSDNQQYYIRATGRTVNGMELDTGYTLVSVEYVSPTVYSLVKLENLPNEGQIKISYNAQLVTGISSPEPIYIDSEKIDLINNGAYVYWDNGFEIREDGIIQIVGQDFKDYSVICEWSNGKDKLEVKYMRGLFESQIEEKAYFILRAYNQITNYVIYSNYIPIPPPTDRMHLWIKRVDNIYSIQCEILD